MKKNIGKDRLIERINTSEPSPWFSCDVFLNLFLVVEAAPHQM